MAEPTKAQIQAAQATRDAVKACGWGMVFVPSEPQGQRVKLKDPGTKGRLDPALRAAFNRHKEVMEIMQERNIALSRLMVNGQATQASQALTRALELFPGSRVVL